MFRGINAIQLDEKGRMAIPIRYREHLQTTVQGRLVVTIETETRCLLLYPSTDWEQIEQKISALPSFNPVARRIQRLLLGHATEVELDGQGRILVPPPLREYGGLQKSVVLVGQGKKFEIWDETFWNASRKNWLEEGLMGAKLPEELENLSL